MSATWKRNEVRLALIATAVGTALWAFAYWWLGNTVHETIGLIFCAVILRHVLNNLVWWKRMGQGTWTVVRMIQTAVNLALAVCVLVLLGTSIAVSRSLLAFLPLPDIFVLREIHWFSAYWFLVLMAVHLGMNSPRIATALARITGVSSLDGRWWGAIWIIALTVAVQGISSGATLGVWPRLLFRYSLTMWDFNSAVLPFFGHLLAVITLFIILGRLAAVTLETLNPTKLRRS